MAYKTMSELVTLVEKALYQSAGPQVQLYSQELIQDMVQQAFTHITDGNDDWPWMVKRERRILDGVTGQVTVLLTDITSYDSIIHVYREGSTRPLSILPSATNTYRLTGNCPRFIEAMDNTKLFRVWPLNATGNIEVVGRKTYDDFLFTDIVPFDPTALVHFAAWSYFTDDESLASAEKHRTLFEARIKSLRNSAFSQPILLDPHSDSVPDRWGESPY